MPSSGHASGLLGAFLTRSDAAASPGALYVDLAASSWLLPRQSVAAEPSRAQSESAVRPRGGPALQPPNTTNLQHRQARAQSDEYTTRMNTYKFDSGTFGSTVSVKETDGQNDGPFRYKP